MLGQYILLAVKFLLVWRWIPTANPPSTRRKFMNCSSFLHRMQKLVKPSADKKYVDLTVSFAPETDGEEDLPGPPVRYYFVQEDNWW